MERVDDKLIEELLKLCEQRPWVSLDSGTVRALCLQAKQQQSPSPAEMSAFAQWSYKAP